MRIAIIGPAGSGKTTFAEKLSTALFSERYTLLNCDEWIAGIYKTAFAHASYGSIKYIRKVCPQCFVQKTFRADWTREVVDKAILGTFLLRHTKERRHFEDLLFVLLKRYINCYPNIIVEGLMPRFLRKIPFDVVLYVHTEAAERKRRLKKRGVSQERIREIEQVQAKLFRDPVGWRKS